MTDEKPRGVHIVGSIPLGDAENVFRTTADVLGERLGRVTDGETGGRLDWIVWQLHRLMQHPQFEMVEPGPRNYAPNPRVALKEGVFIDDLEFGSLGSLLAYVTTASFRHRGAFKSACPHPSRQSKRSWCPVRR